jgi:hypothetical protein
MGRRQLVPFLDDLRGRFSKIVFSSNLAGPYFRRYVKPYNPKTSAQMDMRAIISEVSKDWQSLTQSQQEFWKNYLPTLKEWYLGAAERLSAFNAFTMVASQIKTGIEVSGNTTITNDTDWDKTDFTYTKTVQPAGKPPIGLKNIESFSTTIQFQVVSGIPRVFLTVNLTNNTMNQDDYLESLDGRKISFVLWVSNPGKYITSNMKPMVLKVMSTGKLKIKKSGSQVSTISAQALINNTYFTLAPQSGNYIFYSLGLQTEDGPYVIIKEDIEKVL